MQSKTLLATALLAGSIINLTGCQSTQANQNIQTDGNHVHINNIDWQKHSTTYTATADDQIPQGLSHVVFIRPATNLDDQSSANIALNNRYLVSLQGGNYTESNICAGPAELSIVPTSNKSNDLHKNATTYNLPQGKTSYFYVNVDNNGQPTLTQLTESNALTLLNNKNLQTHQVSRIVNNCTPIAPVQTPAPIIIKRGDAFRLGVQFDTNKSNIKPQYQSEITQVATYLKQHPELNVTIEGHTDNVGKDTANQALSERRAEAVKNALLSQGVLPNNIDSIGYGETRPIATNNTPEGRQQNRRVIVLGR